MFTNKMYPQLIFIAKRLSHPSIAHENQKDGELHNCFLAQNIKKYARKYDTYYKQEQITKTVQMKVNIRKKV